MNGSPEPRFLVPPSQQLLKRDDIALMQTHIAPAEAYNASMQTHIALMRAYNASM